MLLLLNNNANVNATRSVRTYHYYSIVIIIFLYLANRSIFFSDSQYICSLILVMNDGFNIFSHSRTVRLHYM